MKKLIILIVILLILAAGAAVWVVKQKGEGKTASVEPAVVQVQHGNIMKTVSTTGYVVPNREVEIKCKASGEVVRLPFDISDTVKKGDLLLELNPQDEDFSVQERKAGLKSAQAKLEQARLSISIAEKNLETEKKRAEVARVTAETAYNDAEMKAERAKKLWEKQLGSQEEYETAVTASSQAKAVLENANVRIEEMKSEELQIEVKKQDLILSRTEVESKEISLKQAVDRLNDTKIMSPMDGVVTSRDVQIGQIIASAISNIGGGTAVLTLADLSRMFVYASVDESDIGNIRKDQAARVTVDAYPDLVFKGKVVRIGTRGKNVSNIITYEVRIEITKGDISLLKPEMSADIEIIIAHKADALIVPVQSLFRAEGGEYVMVKKQGLEPVPQPVSSGICDDEHVEILKGLSEGETIIANMQQSAGKWKKQDRGGGPPGIMPGMPRRRGRI